MWQCKNQLPSFLFSKTYSIKPRCRSSTPREMYTSHSSITQVCENLFPSHESLKLYRDFSTTLNSHECNTWLPKTFSSGRLLTVMLIPVDAKISMCDAEGVALKNVLSQVLRSTKCKISKSSYDFNESVYPIPFHYSLIGKNHSLLNFVIQPPTLHQKATNVQHILHIYMKTWTQFLKPHSAHSWSSLCSIFCGRVEQTTSRECFQPQPFSFQCIYAK